MKIAVLGTRGVPAEYGGFETFAEFLSVGLAAAGEEVYAYCPDYQRYREPEYKRVKLVRIWHPERYFRHRHLRAACTIVFDVLSMLHACRARMDVIYMLGYASGPGLVIARLFGRPLAVNPDGLEWKSTRWGPLARAWLFLCEYLSARVPQLVIADAEPIARRFRDKYGVDALCIPYGTEIVHREDTPPVPHADDSFYLAVARMVPETKIPTIIDGFRLSGSERTLLVVGPIADRAFFETQVEPRVDGDRVRYLGAIYDRGFLRSLRARAAALIHGHASEGTNPSLLESMGCGSPVLAIRRQSNIDAAGEEGALYYDDDPASLAEQIRAFEGLSGDERRRMGEATRARAAALFSWDAAVERHRRAFVGLANGGATDQAGR